MSSLRTPLPEAESDDAEAPSTQRARGSLPEEPAPVDAAIGQTTPSSADADFTAAEARASRSGRRGTTRRPAREDTLLSLPAPAEREELELADRLEDMERRWPGFESGTEHYRAQTYDAIGNATAAIEWYEKALDSYNEGAVVWGWEIATALRRLGELYDARENDAKAIEYYGRFIELWKDADPELQPMVRRAEARLAALVPRR